MNEYMKAAEEISNGMVDIYRLLENGDCAKKEIALDLINYAMAISQKANDIGHKQDWAEAQIIREELLEVIGTSKMYLTALIFSKTVAEKQAGTVLDSLVKLRDLVKGK